MQFLFAYMEETFSKKFFQGREKGLQTGKCSENGGEKEGLSSEIA